MSDDCDYIGDEAYRKILEERDREQRAKLHAVKEEVNVTTDKPIPLPRKIDQLGAMYNILDRRLRRIEELLGL
jgi:hypothetical protein